MATKGARNGAFTKWRLLGEAETDVVCSGRRVMNQQSNTLGRFVPGALSGFDSSHVFCFIVHCPYLLVIPLGPDHPWCASGNVLTYHCACVSTWWNTDLC